MDILITDSILREFLDTSATPKKIAEYLSLCGPSIEKISKVGKETVYHIEVTTNRVDMASAYGIAKEAVAILPEFEINAKLKKLELTNPSSTKDIGINFKIDKKICERFTAIKLSDVTVSDSPDFIKDRLFATGQRPLNNIIDITNYAMMALGIPMHAFDFDKLGTEIIVREAKKGEDFTALDHKKHIALGGEIVFDNGKGEIIDIPGVMGTENTMVTKETKTVLLVMEHMDHHKVREASLKHEIRSNAAILNEKDPDPNNIDTALRFACHLYQKYADAEISSKIFDWYPEPREEHTIKISEKHIDKLLGQSLGKRKITDIIERLDFKVSWKGEVMTVIVPTSRVQDVTIPEDIIEEIARIYGYFKLPSVLPTGKLPTHRDDSLFKFEDAIKKLLKGWGGVEVYTLSMVSKDMVEEGALKIKNPLGGDGEFMRTNLTPSLILAAKSNSQEQQPFHLFEIANVYIPKGNKLPDENSTLCGVFANTDFRKAKGILEALFGELNNNEQPVLKKHGHYYTYEYPLSELMKNSHEYRKFVPISIYPPQIEDLTLIIDNTKIGDVISTIKKTHKFISEVSFLDSYENSSSFRIMYSNPVKTLTDEEVASIRKEVLKELQKSLAVIEK